MTELENFFCSMEIDMKVVNQIFEGNCCVYYGAINDFAYPIMYKSLRNFQRNDRFRLILISSGGDLLATRRLGHALRSQGCPVSVIIPYRARSAATLLSLIGDEILISSFGDLGPIDVIQQNISNANNLPNSIASSDVRLFTDMVKDWFNIEPVDRPFIFESFASKIFPTTLTTFYRAEKLVRQIGCEFLNSHSTPLNSKLIEKAIDFLLTRGLHHDYPFFFDDLKETGLNIKLMNSDQDSFSWSLCEKLKCFSTVNSRDEPIAYIFHRDFAARCISWQNPDQSLGHSLKWEVFE
jgi:hypothetical protein